MFAGSRREVARQALSVHGDGVDAGWGDASRGSSSADQRGVGTVGGVEGSQWRPSSGGIVTRSVRSSYVTGPKSPQRALYVPPGRIRLYWNGARPAVLTGEEEASDPMAGRGGGGDLDFPCEGRRRKSAATHLGSGATSSSLLLFPMFTDLRGSAPPTVGEREREAEAPEGEGQSR